MKVFLSYKYLYLIPLLLSAIFSLRSFGLKWPAPYRIFSAFLFVTLFAELFAVTWTQYLHNISLWNYTPWNAWIYNSFHILRFSLFAFFYYKMLNSDRLKRIIKYGAPVIVIFSIVDFCFIQSPHQLNHYTVVFTNIAGVFLALLFFRQILQEPHIVRLSSHPMVWISLGAFIYCSSSLAFFIYHDVLFPVVTRKNYILVNLHDTLNIIQYTIYLIAFLCRPYPQNQST